MPQNPPAQQSALAEVLAELNLGYNGYTDPRLTNPKMWAPGSVNVFSGAFGYLQRSRFANVVSVGNFNWANTSKAFTSLKFYAVPGLSSFLIGDINNQLWAFNSANSYSRSQRLNPYVDPTGIGVASLAGPWSREVLQNILYEMNGQVKQSGRGVNAGNIEGFGLDAPDASPQVIIASGTSQNIVTIARLSGVVTATVGAPFTVPGGNGIGFVNVQGETNDPSFNGTFLVQSGNGTTTLTWNQPGQDTTPAVAGTINTNITKAVGRSYAWAWENANKPHVSAPSPSTQYILYNAQNGQIRLIEPGTVAFSLGNPVVTGTGTLFTQAWVGRHLWAAGLGDAGRIVSVQSATSLTLAAGAAGNPSGVFFQVFDPQATHLRLYETADGGATYFRVQRNVWTPATTTLLGCGLTFFDNGNSEPPNFPFTTETSQLQNVPPPIGQFINEYQGRLLVYGVSGVPQSFFYSNVESTSIGMPQESFAPLNQVTLPIANGKINGMLEFPGSLIIWSDKQDMFRLSGLLTDNTISTTTAASQGASISRLPYNLGSASPFAMDITPLGGIWLTSNAEIWLFTDRYAPRNIGKPVQDILNSITPANLSLARGKYYHTGTRNWFVMAVAANGFNFNNTLLVLDLDLLASNGSPSYFTFDMATNHPSWWVIAPGPLLTQGSPPVTTITPRCDSLETVIESSGNVRLLTGSIDLIQDADFQAGFGTEIQVPGATVILHPFGNETAHTIKRPGFIRFTTNRPPSTLAADGWAFAAQGIDDDFYGFDSPLTLALTPGTNDTSALGGNPNLSGGSPFRHSPELYRIGGVNFVAGRRLKFQATFPALAGQIYQLTSIQLGFSARPPM